MSARCERCGVESEGYSFGWIKIADNFPYCEDCYDPEEFDEPEESDGE